MGHAGDNRFRTTYTRAGNRLTIGPAAEMRNACDGEGVMEQGCQFLAAIESTRTWRIERDRLGLYRADRERVPLARRSEQ